MAVRRDKSITITILEGSLTAFLKNLDPFTGRPFLRRMKDFTDPTTGKHEKYLEE